MRDNLRCPVVMVGYSRSWTIAQSLVNLSCCYDVDARDIFLFLDAPIRDDDCEKCDAMYKTAAQIKSIKLPNLRIVRRSRNFGVPGNLIEALNQILEEYGRAIFFEDDVLVSRTFLRYMDQALNFYQDDDRIFCINGYQHPNLHIPHRYAYDIYLSPRNSAWGFGIWQDRWVKVDFKMNDWDEYKKGIENLVRLEKAGADIKDMIDRQQSGKIHTWDVQCTYHMMKHNMFAIEPRYGMTKNIGFGSEGVHCSTAMPLYQRQCYYDFLPALIKDIAEDSAIISQFKYLYYNPMILPRLFRKIRRALAYLKPNNRNPKLIKVI